MGILDRAKPVIDFPAFYNIAIYADGGAGKTVFSCGEPKTLLLDIDPDGSMSLFNHPDVLPNVERINIASFDEVDNISWELRGLRENPYNILVVDTATELENKRLNDTMRKVAKRNTERNKYVPSQAEYVETNRAMQDVLLRLFELPMHVIVTSHSKEENDANTGTMLKRPSLSPSTAAWLQGIVHVLGFMKARTDKSGNFQQSLQTRASNSVQAKTRLNLPPVMEDPKLSQILTAHERGIENGIQAANSGSGESFSRLQSAARR